MSGRLFAAFAWTLWTLTAASIGLGIVLLSTIHVLSLQMVATAISFNAFPLVGAVILARRPRNAIGWICLAIGIGTAITFFDTAYRMYCTFVFGKLTILSLWLDWVGNWVWSINLGLAAALVALFPTGRPLSARWRWLVWALVLTSGGQSISAAFLSGRFSGESVTNPMGMPALHGILQLINDASGGVFPLVAILAAATPIWRFWRSRGDEREQLKWFAYGVAILVACAIFSVIFLSENNNLIPVGIAMLPLGIGIAVLRYRLFDIDVIIRRTLIYGALTAVLAAMYFAVVIAAQFIGERATGQISPPAWLIVITTLLIAALFTPLRRRIQSVIDRRFYRRRYDAARTVEAFAATLRTELDLTDLSAHLVDVVDDIMRPAHASLWIREVSRGAMPGAEPSHGVLQWATNMSSGRTISPMKRERP